MILAFHNAFSSDRLTGNAIDFILPKLAKDFSEEFCRFVDGGAGIGGTAMEYSRILAANLDESAFNKARITCYEPLLENYTEMTNRLANIDICRLRNAAIANTNGTARFCVPRRQTGNSETWGKGTSYDGFLNDTQQYYESIEVNTVRMEDDLDGPQDFVKLDLQGGELDAIRGLGKLLSETKLLYIEAQLMKDNDACQYLAENGFALFFDKFQFGLMPGATEVPITQLTRLGISIDRMRLSNNSGMPLILWGYVAKNGRDLFNKYSFVEEVREYLKGSGIQYMQTDAICVNVKYSNKIFPAFDEVI